MSDFMFDQESLKNSIGKLLLSIQIERNTDFLAAQRTVDQVKELARTLKGSELLPRSVLYELRMTVKVLRAEIPYLKNGVDDAVKAANEIEMAFDLILCGECHEDRVPGVPRIV